MDDYGHFGKGPTGYAHYTTAQKNSGGGDSCGCGGCLLTFWIVIGIVVLIGAFLGNFRLI